MIARAIHKGIGTARRRMRKAAPQLTPVRAIAAKKKAELATGLQKDGAVLTIATHVEITPRIERFSHEEACRVARAALLRDDGQTVVLDLRHAREVTTAAFARLVLLRRKLREVGRDLRLTNLRDRAANLYEVSRLTAVLPVA